MSMSHPEPPSSTIHGELRGRIISPPMPPPPPLPPPGAGIELLRETVEVQARTIRYLLTNYEALLRKVERDEERYKSTVEYSVGADRSFAANANVPVGWWVVVSSGSHDFHHTHGSTSHSNEYNQGEVLFSNGTHHKTSGTVVLAPIETKVTTVEIESNGG